MTIKSVSLKEHDRPFCEVTQYDTHYPNCGGSMKIVALIGSRQQDILRKILEHCGLWQHPPSRGPPGPTRSSHPGRQACNPDSRLNFEANPDFLEHARCEELEQPQLPWDP